MGSRSTGATLRHLRSIFGGGSLAGLADAELIDRFLDDDRASADAAFSALVERHGPMVHRVCRGVLGRSNEADADDAFQAVFLVLSRRAGSLRGRDAIAPWLFGVARRVTRKARVAASRRSKHERIAAERRPPAVPDEADRQDDWSALYDEIDRLPPAFRAPVVLCGLEGRSAAEAASVLGVAEGTIHSRLSRARDRLRRRLSRRGVALGLSPLPFSPRAASSGPPESLIDATIRLAVGLAAGRVATGEVPAAVAILATSLSRRTLLMNAGLSISLLALALAPASAGLGIGSPPDEPPPPTAGQATPKPADLPGDGEPLHVLVVEQDGTPAPGVPVRVENFVSRGTFVTDADGRAVVPRRARGMSLIADRGASPPAVDGSRPARPRAVGFWKESGRVDGAEIEEGPATITLRPMDHRVSVRVLDNASGRPAEGARVFVGTLMDQGPFRLGIRRLEATANLSREQSIGLFGDLTTGPDGIVSLPLPVRTTLTLNTEARHLAGPPVAVTGMPGAPSPFDVRLAPAGGIAGRVTDSKTGEPVAGIRVVAALNDAPVGFPPGSHIAVVETGPDGRYLFPGLRPGVYVVRDAGGPLSDRLAPHVVGVRVDTSEDAHADLELVPTRRLSGVAVSADDGRPIPGLLLGFVHPDQRVLGTWTRTAETDKDGRFAVTLMPGTVQVSTIAGELRPVGGPKSLDVAGDRDPDPIRLRCEPRPGRVPVTRAPSALPTMAELRGLAAYLARSYWRAGDGDRVIQGRVVDAAGEPVAGVHLWAIRDHQRDAEGRVRGIPIDGKSATTDREGVFILGNQPQGDLTLGLYKPQAGVREEVVAAGRDEVEFVLPTRR